MTPSDMTDDQLRGRIVLLEKYPQMNSPSDWTELAEYKAELSGRGIDHPERQDATDFAYRLQRYGY